MMVDNSNFSRFLALNAIEKISILSNIIMELTLFGRDSYEKSHFDELRMVNEQVNRICGYLRLLCVDQKLDREDLLVSMVVEILDQRSGPAVMALQRAIMGPE